MLSSRERLSRLLNNQEIDRIPIWLLAPFHRVSYYADIYNLECYRKITAYIERYCDTFDRRNYNSGFCYNANPSIRQWKETAVQNGNTLSKSIVQYKDTKWEKVFSTGKSGTHMKYHVEDIDDLMRVLDIPYVAPTPDLSSYSREKEELGDRGLMMIDIGDPLCPLYKLMSASDFSIFSLTDFDKILEFTDEMYRRVMAYYRYFLENNAGDVFFIVGAEFAGPPLVSPDKFNLMSARYVKGIVDLIREYGKKSIVHYHGNLSRVLEGMKTINPDGLHTVEAPPIGDCTLAQAREHLGNMPLIGNIQYDDLAHRDAADIEQMVMDAINEAKSGRFILSPTAGPYENSISDKMVENYLTFIQTGIKYGKLK